MQLTKDQAREVMDEFLEAEGVIDHGSIRRDKAAEHFARDLEAFDEQDARDDERVPAWFIRDFYAAFRYSLYAVAAVAFVIALLTA